MYVGLLGGRRRSFSASPSKITATCRRLTALKSSENLTTTVKQCRELFCPSVRKRPPADRSRKGLNHPLVRRNIAGAVGIASLSWPCMYLGFLAMYRGMKSIKPYSSKVFFPAHLLKCACRCQSRVKAFASLRKVIGGVSTEKGIREYLTLLSVCETCKYKGVSFLEFLRSGESDIDVFMQKGARLSQEPGFRRRLPE